jgi:ferredoxin
MSSLPLPVLDETLCTACGDCVTVCPTQCLAMDGRLPWLPRPGRCVRCALCVGICPTDALSIETLWRDT